MDNYAEDMEDTDDQSAIPPQEFVALVLGQQNLAEMLDDKHLSEIAQQVISDYEMDKESMSDWFEKMQRGLDLATLVKDDRSYPFENSANVKYPLVTSAALQFNARALPAIVPNDRTVKAKVWGKDESGQKAARAERVSEHMSWQLAASITEWEEETDKLLVQLPIVGESFRKWWYDPAKGRPACRLIAPGKLIVNSNVKTLTDAPRVTEELELYPNEIESRVRAGLFLECEYEEDAEDSQAAHEFIEQHTRLDLDEDDYAEPYVVTVHKKTQKVVKIVADFREEDVQFKTETKMIPQVVEAVDPITRLSSQVYTLVEQEVATGIISINRGTHFVGFKFLPSMDGSYHGTGLGLLLGDISDTINTIINMMLDAGHYHALGGGFIGQEFRMGGGSQRFKPGEWKKVQTTGQAVRDSMVPLTFPAPDGTLFQMLGMLIDAGREIASVKDVVTGEAPRQQQTATTTLALIEQGMMVFTAAYKRIFRSLKEEYRLLARMNGETVSPEQYAAFHDEQGVDVRADYNLGDMDIQPVADPRSVTKMQQAAKAQLVMQLAEQGLVDKGEALSRVAEAMDIEDVEALAMKPDPMVQETAMLQLQSAKADLQSKMADIELTIAKIEETRSAAIENIANAESDVIRARNEERKTRLDEMKALLEDDRQRISDILQSVGRMAGQSSNANAARGNGQYSGAPQAGGGEYVLVGQPDPGTPAGGFGPR